MMLRISRRLFSGVSPFALGAVVAVVLIAGAAHGQDSTTRPSAPSSAPSTPADTPSSDSASGVRAPAQSAGDVATSPAGAAASIPTGGPFVYALVADSSESIPAAINRTVQHMSFITRPIARGRLTKVNPLPHILRVDLRADSASIAFDKGNPVVTPVSGDTVNWHNPLADETDRAHMVTTGDTLRQFIAAADGTRENALIFMDGGERVRLRVTVTSHRLPRPLVYELLFRRDSTAKS